MKSALLKVSFISLISFGLFSPVVATADNHTVGFIEMEGLGEARISEVIRTTEGEEFRLIFPDRSSVQIVPLDPGSLISSIEVTGPPDVIVSYSRLGVGEKTLQVIKALAPIISNGFGFVDVLFPGDDEDDEGDEDPGEEDPGAEEPGDGGNQSNDHSTGKCSVNLSGAQINTGGGPVNININVKSCGN